MAYKGKYKVVNIEKYKGDPTDIVYRSLWELKVFNYCDSNPSVVRWNSECVIIPYISPVDNKPHRYFVDLWIQYKDKDGKLKEKLIEIKPKCQTILPKQSNTRSRKSEYKFTREMNTFLVNSAKWEYARKWASKNNMEFVILTEDEIFPKKKKSNKGA